MSKGYPHDKVCLTTAQAVVKFLAVQYSERDSNCLLYTSPSPRDLSTSRMPSSA